MSVGLRTSRIKVYDYTSTSDVGVPSAVYVLRETRWARRATPTGREATIGQQAGHTVDAIFTFHDEADVRSNDLLLDGTERFLVRAVLPRPMLREVQVHAQRTLDEGVLLNLDES